jgi:hypothetical protein
VCWVKVGVDVTIGGVMETLVGAALLSLLISEADD